MVLASCYVKWNRTTEYYTGWKGKLSEDGGGVIINQAIHGVDLLQWFAGMPVEVFAWSDAARAPDRIRRHLRGRAQVWQWRLWHHRRHHGHLAGLVAPHRDLRREQFGGDGRRRHLALGFPRRALPEDEKMRAMRESAAMGSGAAAPMNIKIEGHVRQIQDFIDGILDEAPVLHRRREARKAVALVRAIYDSAATGRAVRPDGASMRRGCLAVVLSALVLPAVGSCRGPVIPASSAHTTRGESRAAVRARVTTRARCASRSPSRRSPRRRSRKRCARRISRRVCATAGLTDVTIDAAGNVIGKRKGAGGWPAARGLRAPRYGVPEGSDVTVTRNRTAATTAWASSTIRVASWLCSRCCAHGARSKSAPWATCGSSARWAKRRWATCAA